MSTDSPSLSSSLVSSPLSSPRQGPLRSLYGVPQTDAPPLDFLCREEFGFNFPKLKERIRQQSEDLQSLIHGFSEEVLQTPESADRRDLAKNLILKILEINQNATDRSIRTLVKMQSAFLERVQTEKEKACSELARFEAETDELKFALLRTESEKESMEAEAMERLEEEKAILEVSLREELQACQICEVNQRNVVIMPCMHGHYCADCLEGHQKTNKTCPSCRSIIKGTIPYIA